MPNVITRILINGSRAQKRETERLEDATLLALKIEEGGNNQGIQAALRSWKRQVKGFSPRGSRKEYNQLIS